MYLVFTRMPGGVTEAIQVSVFVSLVCRALLKALFYVSPQGYNNYSKTPALQFIELTNQNNWP